MPAPKKTTTKTAAKKTTTKKAATTTKTAAKKPATKSVAAKKTTTETKTSVKKAPAVQKATVKKVTVTKKATSSVAKKSTSAKKVAVVAAIDVGFGNRLTIRGEGAGLSWTTGQSMDWKDGQWEWKPSKTGAFNFKILLNDEVWSQGENVAADGKKEVVVTPQF